MKKLLLILAVTLLVGCSDRMKIIDEKSYLMNSQIPTGATDIEIIDYYFAYFTLDGRRYIISSDGMSQITKE